MRLRAIEFTAIALLLGMVVTASGQRKITITGGPGSDDTVSPPPLPVVATDDGLSEERIRQIVRDELSRAGFGPFVSAPVGVSPGVPQLPTTTGTVTSVFGRTNTITRTNLAGRVITNTVTRTATVITNPARILTPAEAGVVQPGTVGQPGTAAGTPGVGVPAVGAPAGGSVGVLSGGSAGVGVATPSGAGANRATATQPNTTPRPATGR